MKKLHFSYDMHIEYSIDVSRCNYTIKCMPLSNKRQRISNISINMQPLTIYHLGVDGLSNVQIYGVNEMPHKTFDFHIEGDAATGLEGYEELANDDKTLIFTCPHGFNIAGNAIKDFYKHIDIPNTASSFEKAVIIMDRLNKFYKYKALVTDINTTAEEAFRIGNGVCQDYAHIFISLLHLAKIPARYVTGLVIGEGESHAWVEVLDGDKWIGLDPTNNCVVSDDHIKIGVGRDARDCTINRGIMHGGGLHIQTVKVVVKESEED